MQSQEQDQAPPAPVLRRPGAPWFGSIAIACGALATGALLALGAWADAGLGEMSGGLRLRTIQAEQAEGKPVNFSTNLPAQTDRAGASASNPPEQRERLRPHPI